MIMASNKTENHQHDHTQQNKIYSHHQQDFGMMMQPSSSATPFSGSFNNINKNGAPFDLSILDDQAFIMFIDGQEDPSAQNSAMRPPTLNIFPSQPMHAEPSKAISSGLVSPARTSGSKKSSEPYMELTNPNSDVASAPSQPHKVVKREGNNKGNSSGDAKTDLDEKTLRRLAQNREAARKSRLRKKAYVQQLEASKLKLVKLEQELLRAKNQGSLFLGGNNLFDQGFSGPIGNINSAAAFDMGYYRWLDEHSRMMTELRNVVQDRLITEQELQVIVDKCLGHYDQLMNLRSMMVKVDVLHILSGMWKTPLERWFLWLGGFRPSMIIKISTGQIEPLTTTQSVGICRLEQFTEEAEAALSRGHKAFKSSLSETIFSESLTTNNPDMEAYMNLAVDKLASLEGFVLQADSLRRDTLHGLRQIFTPFQVARCLLAIAEYFNRFRALNSISMSHYHQG